MSPKQKSSSSAAQDQPPVAVEQTNQAQAQAQAASEQTNQDQPPAAASGQTNQAKPPAAASEQTNPKETTPRSRAISGRELMFAMVPLVCLAYLGWFDGREWILYPSCVLTVICIFLWSKPWSKTTNSGPTSTGADSKTKTTKTKNTTSTDADSKKQAPPETTPQARALLSGWLLMFAFTILWVLMGIAYYYDWIPGDGETSLPLHCLVLVICVALWSASQIEGLQCIFFYFFASFILHMDREAQLRYTKCKAPGFLEWWSWLYNLWNAFWCKVILRGYISIPESFRSIGLIVIFLLAAWLCSTPKRWTHRNSRVWVITVLKNFEIATTLQHPVFAALLQILIHWIEASREETAAFPKEKAEVWMSERVKSLAPTPGPGSKSTKTNTETKRSSSSRKKKTVTTKTKTVPETQQQQTVSDNTQKAFFNNVYVPNNRSSRFSHLELGEQQQHQQLLELVKRVQERQDRTDTQNSGPTYEEVYDEEGDDYGDSESGSNDAYDEEAVDRLYDLR